MNILYASRPITFDDQPLSWLQGNLIAQPNGQYSIQKPNGMYLSIDVTGTYQESPSPRGSWEYFNFSTANLLLVTPDKVSYVFAIKQQ